MTPETRSQIEAIAVQITDLREAASEACANGNYTLAVEKMREADQIAAASLKLVEHGA